MSLKDTIIVEHLPKHIAVIMDGNGRWAKDKGEDRLYGHWHGVESVREVTTACAELGIEYLTLYAFSTENWDRPEYEVNGLMELLVETIKKEVPTLNKNNIKLHVIGDTAMLPASAKTQLEDALQETKKNTGLNLIMALSYSSRWEITKAIQHIAADVEQGKLKATDINKDTIQQVAKDAVAGKINADEINQNTIHSYLQTKHFPDPELMIRTSGEYRISNFLLYQLAYTELYFTDTFWPDFRKENLYEAIADFQKRERRFGKTSEQVKTV
jgi:undecaprenyl diphosphate synthase